MSMYVCMDMDMWKMEMAMHATLSNNAQAHPPHKITHVNQPWCEMCGYTLEEASDLPNLILPRN